MWFFMDCIPWENAGICCESFAYEELANSILKVIEEKVLLEELERNGVKYYENNF